MRLREIFASYGAHVDQAVEACSRTRLTDGFRLFAAIQIHGRAWRGSGGTEARKELPADEICRDKSLMRTGRDLVRH
jgi:hypothetical protein